MRGEQGPLQPPDRGAARLLSFGAPGRARRSDGSAKVRVAFAKRRSRRSDSAQALGILRHEPRGGSAS